MKLLHPHSLQTFLGWFYLCVKKLKYILYCSFVGERYWRGEVHPSQGVIRNVSLLPAEGDVKAGV
jgi:hypothetical protein